MTPDRNHFGAVVAINLQLLSAFGFAVTAWAIWPTTAEWWGLGVMSVLFGLGALHGLVGALRSMAALHAKDRALHDYLARGGPPKQARFASDELLRKKGMIP